MRRSWLVWASSAAWHVGRSSRVSLRLIGGGGEVTLEQDGSQWEQNSRYRLKTHLCVLWSSAFQPANNNWGWDQSLWFKLWTWQEGRGSAAADGEQDGVLRVQGSSEIVWMVRVALEGAYLLKHSRLVHVFVKSLLYCICCFQCESSKTGLAQKHSLNYNFSHFSYV